MGDLVESVFNNKATVSPQDWRRLHSLVEDSRKRSQVIDALEEFVQPITRPEKYVQCCEFIKALAHACRYELQALIKLYRIAGHTSLSSSGIQLSAKHALDGMLVWSNLSFWLDTYLHLVESDKKCIDVFSSELQASATVHFLQMTSAQLMLLFATLRLHSVMATLRSLKVGRDNIDSFARAVQQQLRLPDALEPPREAFAAQTGALLSLLLRLLPIHADLNRGVFYRPEVVHGNQLSYVAMESTKDGSLHSIGRSVFIDLLYGCALMPVRQSRAQAPRAALKKPASTCHCVCGECVAPWRIVGLPSVEEIALLQRLAKAKAVHASLLNGGGWEALSTVLCEGCYRTLHSELGSGGEGGDLVGVGCAPAHHYGGHVESAPALSAVERPEVVTLPAKAPAPVAIAKVASPRARRAAPEVDDDASVASGVSHMNVHDDEGSVASRSEPPRGAHHDLPKLSESEFAMFLCSLWSGIPITLVYSYEPLIEKTRLLHLCTGDATVAEVLRAKCGGRRAGAGADGPDRPFLRWLASKASALFLGWAHVSEQKKLVFNPKKALAVAEIKNIKVGSARWRNCVKIGSASVVIVVKVDHDEQFQILLRGLTQLIAVMAGK